MKKKIIILAGIGGASILILLVVFNHRYPFINPSVGNWSVGFHSTTHVFPEVDLDSTKILTYEHIDSVVPKSIDYIADPFFVRDKDTFYLFVELKGTGNADIALLTSRDGESYNYEGIVLDESFHLSYPQVFKYREEFYMLPETKGSNNVLLYKAENFPFGWKVSDTLIRNYRLTDPTLLLDHDFNLLVGVDDDLRQFMFTADSLKGTWSEAESYKQRWGNETRPGGRFLKVDEDWYLPLQNRSAGYGTGISLYKLERGKDRLEFALAKKLYLRPQANIEWFNRGMHHLDIQELDQEFYMVYDGDRNLGNNREWQYKRTIKFNLIDLYNKIVD